MKIKEVKSDKEAYLFYNLIKSKFYWSYQMDEHDNTCWSEMNEHTTTLLIELSFESISKKVIEGMINHSMAEIASICPGKNILVIRNPIEYINGDIVSGNQLYIGCMDIIMLAEKLSEDEEIIKDIIT